MTFGISASAAFLGGSAILGAGAGIYASSQAAGAQKDAAAQAAQTQKEALASQIEQQAPFRAGGITAQNQLMTLLGLAPSGGDTSGLNVNTASPDYGKYAKDFGMSDFTTDPGYAFRLSQGMGALNNQAAARGGMISGNALRAAQDYGQQAGSQEYQNAYNRYQTNRANQLNPLQSLMGAGQTATNLVSNATGTTGQGVAQSQVAGGNATASGYLNSANAVTNALNQGAKNYMGSQYLNSSAYPNTSGTQAGIDNALGAGFYNNNFSLNG
jgi:hypothetical protein